MKINKVILIHEGSIETIRVFSSMKKLTDEYKDISYGYLRSIIGFNQEITYKGYRIKKVYFN